MLSFYFFQSSADHLFFFFFFQAEDGIRDFHVTGVQTCALPILDQPLPLVLWRLVRRAVRDIVTRRDMFNGNRQTWREAFFRKESLVSFAITSHVRRESLYPPRFAAYPQLNVVRLRSPGAVRRWLASQ